MPSSLLNLLYKMCFCFELLGDTRTIEVYLNDRCDALSQVRLL